MILSFGNKEADLIWNGIRAKGIPNQIQEITRRKLRMINNSIDLNDLMIPPSNRLERLKGGFKDYYSIQVNDQWRIVFKWDNGNASLLKLIDYH